jgi:hypothetical protein
VEGEGEGLVLVVRVYLLYFLAISRAVGSEDREEKRSLFCRKHLISTSPRDIGVAHAISGWLDREGVTGRVC